MNYLMPTYLCRMAPAATFMRCMSLVTTVTHLLRCPTEVLRRLRRSQRETSWGEWARMEEAGEEVEEWVEVGVGVGVILCG